MYTMANVIKLAKFLVQEKPKAKHSQVNTERGEWHQEYVPLSVKPELQTPPIVLHDALLQLRILASALKVRRRRHESNTLIHYPLTDIEILCHRTPNILILEAVCLDSGRH